MAMTAADLLESRLPPQDPTRRNLLLPLSASSVARAQFPQPVRTWPARTDFRRPHVSPTKQPVPYPMKSNPCANPASNRGLFPTDPLPTRRNQPRRAAAWLPLGLLLLCGAVLPTARAVVPGPAISDPMYVKGYLNVKYYGVYPSGDPLADTPAQNTAFINTALADAYAKNKVLYFPTGTYLVTNTLLARTDTGQPEGVPGYASPNPRRHLAMVGATTGSRPVLKLTNNNGGFSGVDAAHTKPLLKFINYQTEDTDPQNPVPPFTNEQESNGYYQRLSGIDLDCGTGNPGAIGLYFNQAQDCSIEDVKITATGAKAGILGLPGRGSVVVNIELVGGDYGIDTAGTGNAGTTIVSAIFRDQKVSSINCTGFVPLVVVGFEIFTPTTGPAVPAVTMSGNTPAHNCQLQLIDGTITLGQNPANAAIYNPASTNFYARNVYVKGSNNLVKVGTTVTATKTGTWGLINEYSYCRPGTDVIASQNRTSYNMINPSSATNTQSSTPNINPNATAPSVADQTSLRALHGWGSKPSFEDTVANSGIVAKDLVGLNPAGVITSKTTDANGFSTYKVSASAFQTYLNNAANQKIFLRAGIYQLNGTITLPADTILFGVDRNLTRIEPVSTWNPTSETPIVAAASSATATTYLGELTIGVAVRPNSPLDGSGASIHDFFTAVDWQAGRDSLVHIGEVYAVDEGVAADYPTQTHSLLRIRGNGGGRWYGVGARKGRASDIYGFHILKVENTTQALSIYGLNLEHAAGPYTYARFVNSRNIRIYGEKSEFLIGDPTGAAIYNDQMAVVTFTDVQNVGLFGAGAIRNSLVNDANGRKGLIQFIKTDTGTMDRVIATMVSPQNDELPAVNGPTLLERRTISGATTDRFVTFPDILNLYKRGTITAADETAMAHADIHYGQP